MRSPILPAAILAAMTIDSLRCQDLPPPQNPAALLKELDQITKGAQSRDQQRRSEAISRIQAAASSPSSALEIYLTALDATKYADKHPDFLDWKQKNQDALRHPSFQNAAQLQLRYLLMGLQRSDQRDAFGQIDETLAYLNAMQSLHFLEEAYVAPPAAKGYQPTPCPADKVTKEAAELMGKSTSEQPVVAWLQIKDLLPEKDFSGSAGDYFGILEKNVKGPLRAKKDPRLAVAWDLQIAAATTKANSSKNSQKAAEFKTDKLPALLFEKSRDTAAIGQPNRAVTEMMALIRSYPTNPSVDDWIGATRKLLTPSESSVTSTNSATNISATEPLPTPSPATNSAK